VNRLSRADAEFRFAVRNSPPESRIASPDAALQLVPSGPGRDQIQLSRQKSPP